MAAFGPMANDKARLPSRSSFCVFAFYGADLPTYLYFLTPTALGPYCPASFSEKPVLPPDGVNQNKS